MEPPNDGHVRDECFVRCSEVVPSSEVEMYCRQGANSVSIIGRLSTLKSVYFRRFHCIQLNLCTMLFSVYRVRSPPDMFSFLTSDLRPERPELDPVALEMAILSAENSGTTK